MSFIPDTAPFNEEQRAWLNGFFAGLTGLTEAQGQAAGSMAIGLKTGGGTALMEAPPAVEEEEDFPWHDESLAIDERMALAEGRPVERKLMAAMAQLNCGSCGYLCQTYSEAIASGAEKNVTLCSPGGKETKQMIKKILAEKPSEASAPIDTNGATNGAIKPPGFSRQNPYTAPLIEARPLNREGSAKDTRHVAIDLTGSGLTYNVGDALGIYPTNCADLAGDIIKAIGADPATKVTTPVGEEKSLLDALCQDCCLKDPPDELLELVIQRTKNAEAIESLKIMLDDGVPEGFDLLDVLELASDVTVAPGEMMETMSPLYPRLYSIASSMRRVGDQVHLTVGKVAYEREGRVRKGVASTMLAERVAEGETVRVFVQPNHAGFTVPADPATPMIMVGPGTGIAPFVSFLQERDEAKAAGKNWLFFGDQHEAFDFLYEEDLKGYVDSGLLTRLDTAFSRDGETKVYVQDRMREHGAELWSWLAGGGCFYVCGDATRMAKDVDGALHRVVAQHGGMSDEEAKAYVKQMAADGRYHRDVY